ncbi:MAG: YfhO family protein [Anaerolineae bacterium]|nr:YfhO family protein [Anaerolineae bacterium]
MNENTIRDRLLWLPWLVLLAGIAVLFHRLALGEVIYWGTPALQFYPWRAMAVAQMRSGELPLWNPLAGSGAPLLANYQTAPFYPLNWLSFVLPVDIAMGVAGVLHLLLAGAGMIAYLRRIGIGVRGQGVGALGFALGAYLVSRFGFLSITSTVPWLPWLLWAAEYLTESGRGRSRSVTVLALLSSLMLLAGHAQTASYSLFMLGIYVVARGWNQKEPLRERALLPLLAAGALIIALMIAAIQLVPTAELTLLSQRADGVRAEDALAYSFWPWRFLTLLTPNLFGSPASGDYRGYGAYWEDATYAGLLTLVMAGHSLLRWWRERRGTEAPLAVRLVPFFWGTAALGFFMALGGNNPVFVWMFEHVPGIDLFRAPARWTLLPAFALPVLAAIGADQWHTSARRLYWTRLLTAGGVAIAVIAWAGPTILGEAVAPAFAGGVARFGTMVTLTGALSLLKVQAERRERFRSWWEVLALGLLVFDLVTAHAGLNPTVPAAFYRPRTMSEIRPYLSEGRRFAILPGDEYDFKFETILDLTDFRTGDATAQAKLRASLLPNLTQIDGIRSASIDDPLQIRYYAELLAELERLPVGDRIDGLERMGVSMLLAPAGYPGLDTIGEVNGYQLYALPGSWPRASAVTCTGKPDGLACEPLPSGEAHITEDGALRVDIEVSLPQDGALLLLDTDYPGWQAAVDGRPAPIRRANHAFRVVDVPAGTHEVTFFYRPASFVTGAVVSVMGLLLAVATAAWPRRR